MPPDVSDLMVLVVADDPLSRAGLAALLAAQPGCSVIGQVSTDSDLPAMLDVYQPDVLVWDLGWDPSQAIEALSDLTEGSPPIVALLPDETHVSDVRAASARGILLRDSEAPVLGAALGAIAQGLVVMEQGLATIQPPDRDPAPSELMSDLTPREREVLGLLAEGLPNKSISDRLEITEHTVKFHVNAILSKLGAQSRTEAVARAIRLGMVPL